MEQRVCQKMEHEYNVYRFIGSSLFIPKLINWESKPRTLVLEDYANGDLETYWKHCSADADICQKWALQVA